MDGGYYSIIGTALADGLGWLERGSYQKEKRYSSRRKTSKINRNDLSWLFSFKKDCCRLIPLLLTNMFAYLLIKERHCLALLVIFLVTFVHETNGLLYKQTALVTGANRGIGFEVCKQLSKKGYHVVLSGRDMNKVNQAVQNLKSEGLTHVDGLLLDATSDQSVDNAFTEFSQKHSHLDVLVNNAGGNYDHDRRASSMDLDFARATMDINLFAPWRVSLKFLPLLKAANSGARIVNVASGGGTRTDKGSGFNYVGGTASAYGLSKMALNGLTTKLALDLQEYNIKVNSACPGFTASGSADNAAGRPVSEGAASIVWAASVDKDGPTGGFFRDGKQIDF